MHTPASLPDTGALAIEHLTISYLRRERESSKFSFEDILSEELRLDRDEGDRPAKAKGTLEK